MEDIQIDINQLIQQYNVKLGDLLGRIVVLETENLALQELLKTQPEQEEE